MKFGMNLLLWTDHLHDGLHAGAASSSRRSVTTASKCRSSAPTKSSTATWGKRLDDLGFERTAVTIRTEAGQPDLARCQGPRRRHRRHQAHARLLPGARRRSRCAARIHSALGLFSGAGPTKDEWKWGVDSMRARRRARRRQPASRSPSSISTASKRISSPAPPTRPASSREVNHPNCRMMYDTFHANIEEKNIARRNPHRRAVHGARAHFRKRPQHARPGPRRLAGNFRHASAKPATTAGWSSKPSASRCRRSAPPPKSGAACTRAKSNSPATRWRS